MDELNKLRRQMSRAFQLHRREENLSADWAVAEHSALTNFDLVDRIWSAYKAAGGDDGGAGDSMWSGFMRDNLGVHEALITRDMERLREVFADPGRTNLFIGFDNLYAGAVAWMRSNDDVKSWFAMQAYDNLLRVLEATRAIRLDNPEQYHTGLTDVIPVEEILTRLDKIFGLPIQFPNPYPDECGLRSSRGVISYRAAQALYQAWKIVQLLRQCGGSSVVEIGAGLGRTAFYARELGVADYTIVDLPFTNVSQAHFLGTVLSPDAISLTGENRRQHAIKIITGNEFLAGAERCDVIVNVDSFTEIDIRIAQKYWNSIEDRSQVFLSINHESNSFTVGDLIHYSQRVQRSSRAPYWLRRGYVEEIVEFAPRNHSAGSIGRVARWSIALAASLGAAGLARRS
jgi:hypothetical protein